MLPASGHNLEPVASLDAGICRVAGTQAMKLMRLTVSVSEDAAYIGGKRCRVADSSTFTELQLTSSKVHSEAPVQSIEVQVFSPIIPMWRRVPDLFRC